MSDEEKMANESAFYRFLCRSYRSFHDSSACGYYRHLRDIFAVTANDYAPEMKGREALFSFFIRTLYLVLLILYFIKRYHEKHALIIGLFMIFSMTLQHGFLKNRKRPVRYQIIASAYAAIGILPQAIYTCFHGFHMSPYDGYSVTGSIIMRIMMLFIFPLGWTIGCLIGYQFRMERLAYEARLRQKREKKIEMIALISVLQRTRRFKEGES